MWVVKMKNKIVKMILIITILLIILDQITKILAINFITEPIGDEYYGLEIVRNTGMAFGFNEGNVRNIFLTIFVLVVVFNFLKNQIDQIDKKTAVALSLVISGGISNLVDRFFRGGVIDFIKLYKIPNFNIADICVIIGWVLIIVFLIDFSKKK